MYNLTPNGSPKKIDKANKAKMSIVESSTTGISVNSVLVLSTFLYVWNFL